MPEHTNSGGQFNHPMYFNPMFPTAGNRVLSLSTTAFAGLLWAGVNASPNADLCVLCPTNIVPFDQTAATTRRIHESTVLSMDLDRPGVSPYIWDSEPHGRANVHPSDRARGLHPTAPANTFPTQAGRPRPARGHAAPAGGQRVRRHHVAVDAGDAVARMNLEPTSP